MEILLPILQRSVCRDAIRQWTLERDNYLSIELFFAPNRYFVFEEASCSWISEHSFSDTFHAYLGICNGNLLLICAPLDEQGSEHYRDDYLAIPFTGINKIQLEETVTTMTIERATIDGNMLVNEKSEVKLGSVIGSSEIGSATAISEITQWSNYRMDWLYRQAGSPNNAIAQVFEVPKADIILSDPTNETSKYCLFAFKWIPVFQQMVMTLVFVTDKSSTARVTGQPMADTITSNSSDFARPCPPFCKNKANFSLL